MSTTLYFTTTLAGVALSGTQSTWSGASQNTINIWSGATGGGNNANSGFSMGTAQGTSVKTISGAAKAQTTAQTHFVQSFISPTLAGAQSLNSGTVYTVVAGTALESAAAAAFFQSGAASLVYQLFAAGTASKIIASGFCSGFVVASTTGVAESGTVIGLGASGSTSSGDRLVLEIWWLSGQQSMATAQTDSLRFGSGNFGFLSVNQTLTFVSPPVVSPGSLALQPQIIRGQ